MSTMVKDQKQVERTVGLDDPKKSPDLGGRRRKADRRRRTSASIFPERRWLRHRRNGGDRRSFPFFNARSRRERREAFRDADAERDD
jgi:hypothetical protein